MNNCGKELTGRKKSYCSDKCRMQHERTQPEQNNPNKPKSNKPEQGMTMTPDGLVPDDKLPINYGRPDCECMHCKSARINNSKRTRNHGAYKPASELKTGEGNRQSLPGDADYIGCCEQFGGAWMTKQAIEQAQSHELN